jgi:hypothetical protein
MVVRDRTRSSQRIPIASPSTNGWFAHRQLTPIATVAAAPRVSLPAALLGLVVRRVTPVYVKSDTANVSACVVVEGVSDQVAIEALAERHGVDLAAAGIRVVRLGGAHQIGSFLDQLGPRSDGPRIAGLCDACEEPVFRRALERAGFGFDLTRADMERLDFYVCVADLEDELIRALGAAAVEKILRANGDLHRFRTLQQMPEWRGRATEEQLRRFMGSGGRRKIRYARILVAALDLERVPRPLDRVLAHAVEH